MRPATEPRRIGPRAGWPTAILVLGFAGSALAQRPPAAPSKQEETRRRLLEQTGLEKAPPKPPAPPPAPAPEPAPPATTPTTPETPASGDPPAAPAGPAIVPFTGRVHQALLTSCRACHAAGQMAQATRLVLDGNAGRDHAAARKLVDPGAPRRSLLLTKATGTQHAGGPTINTSHETYRRLLGWISTGAELSPRAADPAALAAPAATAPGTAPARRPRPRARPVLPGAVAAPGVPVPGAPAVDAPAAGAPAPGSEPTPAPETPTAAVTTEAAPAPMPAEATALHAELQKACRMCHQVGGPAGMTRYKLGGQLEADLAASRAFVDLARPAASVLVTKAAGQPHGGGAPWPEGSAGQKLLLAWIAAGAPDRPPAPALSAAAGEPAAPAAAPEDPALPTPAAPDPAAAASAAPGGHPHGAGALSVNVLGNQLTLNGRFDVSLEQRGFEADPWGDGSKTALTSYHHFLFLGRQSTDDPFVFTAELTSLEFYEAGLRLGRGQKRWRAHLRAGKLLVPFGTEPLFHQSYGGHQGFDQRVLPAIWASEGLAATGQLDAGGTTLSADLYGVRGHALRRADAVLNLQSDLSAADEARLALGARLGAAHGPVGGFYSLYFNPLGHDRRLVLQALDVSLWRWRGVPVLDRLVLGAGALRGDVSGGGAGADYYHFASYWLARIYASDWCYLQYRQGLRTFDNKRNVIYDGRRAGPEDGSTHNFSIVGRYHGLTVGLAYFLNFEKAGEVNDDLARLWVAFEF